MPEEIPPSSASPPARTAVPITALLIAANVIVFVWMAWIGISPRNPNVQRIREFGANFGPYSLGGRPWRLLTANYIHFGWGHFLTNMLCLWGLGRLAEAFYSRRDYLLLYTFAGLGGSLLSVYMNPTVVGMGASGAIFGLAGALLTTLRWGKLPISDASRRSAYKQVLEFAGLNLLLGFGLSLFVNIDNYGHMGGLIAGGLVGLVLGRHLDGSTDSRQYRTVAWVALLFVFLGVGLAVQRSRSFVVNLFAGQEDLIRRRYDSGIAELQKAIQKRPDLVEAYLLIGEAQMAKRDFPAAAAAFTRAADFAPHSPRPLLAAANAYKLAGDLAKAEVTARRLVQVLPRDANSHFLLGLLLLEEKKYPDAEASLQEAIALNPRKRPEYFLALANLYLATKKPDAALGGFEQAFALAPENPLVLNGLVAAHTALGHRSEAARFAAMLAKLKQQSEAEGQTN